MIPASLSGPTLSVAPEGIGINLTLAAVERADPDWAQLPQKTHHRIRELLRRCLTKDSRQRLQAIGEARIVLENPSADANPEADVGSAAATRKREQILAVATAVFALAAIAIGIVHWHRAPEKARIIRSYIKAMPNSTLGAQGRWEGGFAISPDGLRLAYVAQNAEGKALLWARPIDPLQAQLPGTEGAAYPFWSPDSRMIGFFAAAKPKKIEATGGPALTVPNWLLHKTPQEIPAEKREQIAWGEIGHAFSRPVTSDEPVTEYVPTLILAEGFRAHGFDGIVYRSLLGKGLNVALFDCTATELINCGLYETNAVEFKFDQCSNPYFIRKHYEELQKQSADAPKNETSESSKTHRCILPIESSGISNSISAGGSPQMLFRCLIQHGQFIERRQQNAPRARISGSGVVSHRSVRSESSG